MKPQTLPEWEIYIQGLAGRALWSKVVAANTQGFIDALLEEGLKMADIQTILVFFVRQLKASSQKIPMGGAFDLRNIARMDPICRSGKVLTDETVHDLATQPPTEDDGFEESLQQMEAPE